MYDCFWPKIPAKPMSDCLTLLFAWRIFRAFPLMRKTFFQWLGPLLFLPVSVSQALSLTDEVVELPGFAFKYSTQTSARKAMVWRLRNAVETWKQFAIALQYSHLHNDSIFAEGVQGYLKADGTPRISFEIEQLKPGKSFTVDLRIPFYQAIKQQRYFKSSETGSTIFTHEVKFSRRLIPLTYLFLQSKYKRETQGVGSDSRV